MSEPFPEYERSGKTALLAEMVNIGIGAHEILISAASRDVLIKTVKALDPSIDWSDLKSNQVRIAFGQERKPTNNGQLTTDKP